MYRCIKKIRESSGFTLIELLVVMGIFGIILAGILKVFDTSNYTYKVQEEVAEMQQNVRVSKMFLEKDVRMAGCDLKSFFIYKDTESGREQVFPFVFQDGAGDNGSDKLTVSYVDYSEDTCGDDLPDLTIDGTMPAGSSEADVIENLDDFPYNKWVNGIPCQMDDGTTVTFSGAPFEEFMAIIKSPDGSKSDVVWITQVQGGANHIQNHDYPSGQDNKVVNSYPAGSTITFFNTKKLKRYTYYIQNNVLKRDNLVKDEVTRQDTKTTEIIATNIEDMQFAFGLDTNNDGISDEWIADSDPAHSTILTSAQSEQVRLVRITVLGRTASEHRGVKNTQPSIENNHPAATGPDGYRRKLLQVKIKIRNLGLI